MSWSQTILSGTLFGVSVCNVARQCGVSFESMTLVVFALFFAYWICEVTEK